MQARVPAGLQTDQLAPGEWFLNKETSTLYFYPPAGLNLANAVQGRGRKRDV